MDEKDLSEKEKKLIELLRKIPFGRLTVFMQNSQPVRVEEAIKSIVL